MKTYSAKPGDVTSKWWVLDAEELVLGRAAAEVAKILRGKHKPQFTPSMDCGDHVVVINADKVKLTGKKVEQKKYYWHTGYPGGIKERNVAKTLAGKFPERVFLKAVERMMPKDSPLAKAQLSKLRAYPGSEHPHEAQKPEVLDLKARNAKNAR